MIKITIGVDGMMCGMCEAHVNEAIRTQVNAKKITSSHKNGKTVLIAESAPDEEVIRNAIEKSGYKVTSYNTEPYERKGFFSSLFSK